jgi:CRISPR-associated protein Csh1
LPNDKKSLNDALTLFSELDYQIKNSSDISSSEDYLMQKIGEVENNIFTLNLLFFEENPTTKAIKIKIMLEEIPPSRFRELFIEVPKIINKNPLFKDIIYKKKENQHYDLKFSFKLIKQFFENNFYEIVYKIFMGRKINQKELHKHFMDVIRANHKKKINNENFWEKGDILIAKTYMLQNYFEKLNLINYDN